MNWKLTSFNTMTCGTYAVTKTATGYYAWDGKHLLREAPYASFDDAKADAVRRDQQKREEGNG